MRITTNSKNLIFLFSGDIASRFLGFLATIYIARTLGTSKFGIIHIGMAVLAYALIFGNSGLTYLGTRKVAGDSENLSEFTGRLLITKTFLSIITYFTGFVIAILLVDNHEISRIVITYLIYLFPSAILLGWYFQGKKQMGVIALGKFAALLVYLIFILLFVKKEGDLINIAWGWCIGVAVNAILLIVIFRKRNFEITLNWNLKTSQALIRESFPLGIAELISQVVIQFPAIYLGIVATTIDVGLFSAAFKLVIVLLIFDRVFYFVFFPAISRYFKQIPEELTGVFNKVLKIISTLSLFTGLCAILSADFLINVVFGSEFTEAIIVFQVLVGYFSVTMINSVFTYTIIGIEQEKIYTKSLFWGLLVFLAILFAIGTKFGATGSAVALFFYISTSLIIMARGLKSQIEFNFNRAIILPFVFTFGICLPLLLNLNFTLPINLIIAFTVCLPLISFLSGIGFSEIRYLKDSLIWS